MFSAPFVFDLTVSRAIQQGNSDWFNQLMHLASLVFEPALLTGLGLLVAVVLYRQRRRDLIAKVIVLSAGNIFTPFLKLFFARPRPSPTLITVLIHESGFSFPSGHALGIVLFAASLVILFRKPKRWWPVFVGTILVLLVGYSRIYLGVHWITDVLFGYAVAGLWIWAVARFIWPHISRLHDGKRTR